MHYRSLNAADFTIARAGWIADYNDAQNFLYLLESRTGANNYSGFADPEFDNPPAVALDEERVVGMVTDADVAASARACVDSTGRPVDSLTVLASAIQDGSVFWRLDTTAHEGAELEGQVRPAGADDGEFL